MKSRNVREEVTLGFESRKENRCFLPEFYGRSEKELP